MNKSELLNHLKKLPDLDQLEKTIEEHIKSKRTERENNNSSDSEKMKKETNKKSKGKESKKDDSDD